MLFFWHLCLALLVGRRCAPRVLHWDGKGCSQQMGHMCVSSSEAGCWELFLSTHPSPSTCVSCVWEELLSSLLHPVLATHRQQVFVSRGLVASMSVARQTHALVYPGVLYFIRVIEQQQRFLTLRKRRWMVVRWGSLASWTWTFPALWLASFALPVHRM